MPLLWTDEEKETLHKHYGTMLCVDLKNKYLPNRSIGSIRYCAKRIGVKYDKYKYYSLSNRKNNLNEAFFKKPNILNCYYGGLIMADGCLIEKLNRVDLFLNEKDTETLYNFKDSIEYTGKVRSITGKGYDIICTRNGFSIYSKQIIQDLKNLFNLHERKTFTAKSPNIFEENHIKAFIIGIIDGDGSIVTRNNGKYLRFNICSASIDIIKWISNTLEMLYNITANYNLNKTNNCYYIDLSCNNANIILFDLHSINVPKMRRKWDKVKEFKNVPVL